MPTTGTTAAATAARGAKGAAAAAAESAVVALLVADRCPAYGPLDRVLRADGRVRGAITTRIAGGYRRAEPGSCGPLVLEARVAGGELVLEVWGPPATPADEAARALAAARAWVGLDDVLEGFCDLVAGSRVLQRCVARLGVPRLPTLPRLDESFGRAVLGQLVQGEEAWRSTVQVAALAGTPAPGGVWTWPTAAQLGAVAAWALRRCGVSLRAARALHEGTRVAPRLQRLADARAWAALDAALRALPGCGAWTSAETRLALGDADAVSVGDYHLPSIVGTVLGDGPGDDAAMLALVAPYAPHRGRVVRLVERAVVRGVVRGPERRAPRAALSVHRYW